jgi:hypothetical protein
MSKVLANSATKLRKMADPPPIEGAWAVIRHTLGLVIPRRSEMCCMFEGQGEGAFGTRENLRLYVSVMQTAARIAAKTQRAKNTSNRRPQRMLASAGLPETGPTDCAS